MPTAIAAQNCLRSSCPATDGRPGENNGARPDRSERRRYLFIATSFIKVLRQPLESAQGAQVGEVQLVDDHVFNQQEIGVLWKAAAGLILSAIVLWLITVSPA